MISEHERYDVFSEHADFLSRIMEAEQHASRLLPFIPRGLPVFQSHGILHSLAIIRIIHRIIQSPDIDLTLPEIFLLYMAAWFHDIGYLHPLTIQNRGVHPAISAEMIQQDPDIRSLITAEEFPILDTIIRYHDSHTDLTMIQETQSSVRSSLLAALFRLADAVDLGTDRCPPEVFTLIKDGLDEHSRRHWQAHQNVRGIVITYPVITILVQDPENQSFQRRIVTHLNDDCESCNQILKRYGMGPIILEYKKSNQEIF